MTAKEYLQELRALDLKINQKQAQVDELRILATSTRGLRTDKEQVQTSLSGDALSEAVVKYISLENEINKDIDKFVDKKNIIINEIQGLDNVLHMQILYKKYVEFKSLEMIAVEIGYSYDRVRHIHGHALQAFDNKYLKVDTQ